MHEFDFSGKKWSAVDAKNIQLLNSRFAHSAVITHGDSKVYIYGGSTTEGKFLDNVLCYDTNTHMFDKVHVTNNDDPDSLPAGRDFHQVVVVADPDPVMLVIGGKGKKSLNSEAGGRLSEIIRLRLPDESRPKPASVSFQMAPLMQFIDDASLLLSKEDGKLTDLEVIVKNRADEKPIATLYFNFALLKARFPTLAA